MSEQHSNFIVPVHTILHGFPSNNFTESQRALSLPGPSALPPTLTITGYHQSVVKIRPTPTATPLYILANYSTPQVSFFCLHHCLVPLGQCSCFHYFPLVQFSFYLPDIRTPFRFSWRYTKHVLLLTISQEITLGTVLRSPIVPETGVSTLQH